MIENWWDVPIIVAGLMIGSWIADRVTPWLQRLMWGKPEEDQK